MYHVQRRGRIWRGHSVVEFGLVSLVFMMMAMGTADLGRAVFQRQELSNAVREGARFAMVAEDAREGDTLVSQIASAASQRSPSLGLSTTSFQSAGCEVMCQEWVSGSRPIPNQAVAMPAFLGGGLAALGTSAVLQLKPPTKPGGDDDGDDGDWETVSCSEAQPGDRLTVCAGHTFRPVSMALLGLGPIAMTDCSTVTIQ